MNGQYQQPQQPQYQAQQPQYQAPQQPQYQPPQQPVYNQAPQAPKVHKDPDTALAPVTNTIVKLLSVVAIIFLGIGATAILYYTIGGIIETSRTFNPEYLLDGFVTSISVAARYVFYSVVTVIGVKLLKK